MSSKTGQFIFFFAASAAFVLCAHTVLTTESDVRKALNMGLCAMDFIYMQRAWSKVTRND